MLSGFDSKVRLEFAPFKPGRTNDIDWGRILASHAYDQKKN
jgi:hypothetical protein